MAFLHLNFDNFEFRDFGHTDFLSFKVLAPTPLADQTVFYGGRLMVVVNILHISVTV